MRLNAMARPRTRLLNASAGSHKSIMSTGVPPSILTPLLNSLLSRRAAAHRMSVTQDFTHLRQLHRTWVVTLPVGRQARLQAQADNTPTPSVGPTPRSGHNTVRPERQKVKAARDDGRMDEVNLDAENMGRCHACVCAPEHGQRPYTASTFQTWCTRTAFIRPAEHSYGPAVGSGCIGLLYPVWLSRAHGHSTGRLPMWTRVVQPALG